MLILKNLTILQFLILSSQWWITQTIAFSLSSKDTTFFSCVSTAKGLNFDFTPPEKITNGYWYPICHHEPIMGTILMCIHDNLYIEGVTDQASHGSNEDEVHTNYLLDDKDNTNDNNHNDKSQKKYNELLQYTYEKYLTTCVQYGDRPTLTFDQMEKQYHNATLNLVNDTTGVPQLYNPVKVSQEYVRHYESSYAHFIGNFEVSVTYVDIVCMFWIFILTSLAITAYFPSIFKSSKFTITNKFRGWFSLPTILGTHFEPWNIFGYNISSRLPFLKLFDTLLPTLQEFLILSLYFAFLYVVMTYDYATTESNSFLGSAIQQKRRFKADRTGLLAFAQLPPLFLFGGRNNILIKFTGLPFSSFIAFHKWIGRIMVFLAFVHASQFIDFYIAADGLESIKQLELWHYGFKAFHFGALLLIQVEQSGSWTESGD
ncbi:unnamed protein product [Ambrosiozyma monospora]|uniref:Unnamed protein product n=1 Tax=Ambrosiozyma monospora TaxID=43982 RepID=A0ACB5TV99_AMBMO|nr:unnamed protein product [Ambrosiozyma monospora]